VLLYRPHSKKTQRRILFKIPLCVCCVRRDCSPDCLVTLVVQHMLSICYYGTPRGSACRRLSR
jgi:hypothetical protein